MAESVAYNPYDVACPRERCKAPRRKGCKGKRHKVHGERAHLAKKEARRRG